MDTTPTKTRPSLHKGEVEAVVYEAGIRRLNNSRNGNPRYEVAYNRYGHVEHAVTSSDHSFAYSLLNDWNGRERRRAALTFTRAGRISNLRYLD